MAGAAKLITRFAPSPTGPLHLGHAYSALTAWDSALAVGGAFLLRIEDNDTQRCRPAYEQAVYDDLAWLGLRWPSPVMRLSDRKTIYDQAIAALLARGLAYPCSCTRRDIQTALSAPQEGVSAPHLYPGTCRHRTGQTPTVEDAIRLNMAAALEQLSSQPLQWRETGPDHAGLYTLAPDILARNHGDIILMRRDIRTAAYHLSVVIDDAAQNITHVIRGQDLIDATAIHRLLQALLDLPTPIYHHHRLIRDAQGKRLAKRDDAKAISTYRAAGMTPQQMRHHLGL
ncbi:tRNA glutamyl-Q(34) synthetase GluQRS [Thioclava sp. SK-1]|uniref:tRNA glutamyl-Q(34) synthetase GluQRS n=1 Tax=Thioclava sp. SK-1 TaxID=1889770 RepID=UPI0008246F77|nr:tRNA glutamyl-Q(34) synthetase GluQRS [Thioclava sp. SK-1]OCX67064.1 tRNA glutamyl-Q(34) synthetase GluQRS [Thioclava sp. SK-1]